MSKPPEFVSQITSFPTLSPEDNETGVSVLISKFFKFGRNSPAEQCIQSGPIPEDLNGNNSSKESSCETVDNTDVGSSSQYFDEFGEGRSVHKALRRISSLIVLKGSGGTKYSDTEQARYWMPDNVSRECYECGVRFSAFRRRHHCRVCGQIFCARCCSHRVPGHVFNCAGGLRVCTYCCEVVLRYIQSVDSGTVLSADLKALFEKLKDKIPKPNAESLEHGFLMGSGGEMLKEGSVAGDLGGEIGISRYISLQDTFKQLCFSLPLQQHRYRLVRYPSVWRGGDIIQWLLEHTDISTTIQASKMCQSLLREGLLESVTEPQFFTEYSLYKPVNPPSNPVSEHVSPNAVGSITGSVSSYCLNLNLAESSVHLVRGQRIDENNEELQGVDHAPLQSDGTDDIKSFFEIVEATGTEHLRLLLVQELNRAGLNLSWGPILLPLCQQVANMITPDIVSSEWDIRRCVRVKRVVGGSMRESCAVGGVIFTKNVAHRRMPTALTSPRLLLLRCSLVYQRVEDKLMSLEPVIMQEQEYLRNCCARIFALNPDVVIIQGRVSRIAQDELRRRGIVLVIGVRGPTLYRLARCTRADILTSIDAHVGSPRLGTCKAFYLLNYDSKTLMVFEGYSQDLNGCSMILRGGTLEELGRVKKVTSLVLLSAYNWRLESSLLKDMCATLPTFGTSLMFNDNSPEKENELNNDEIISVDIDENKVLPNPVCKQILQYEDVKSTVNPKLNSISAVTDSKLEIAITDPLTSDFSHKSEFTNKKNDSEKGPLLSCGITVNDFSDPLRSRKMSTDDDVFIATPKTTVYEPQVDTLRNRWSADEAVLSMSPHVRICAPYLESELGRCSPLRHYFCTPLYPPPTVIAPSTPKTTNKFRKQSTKTECKDFNLKDPHPFVEKALVHNAEETDVRRLLAHYRAVGGRLQHDDFSKKKFTKNVESKHDVAVDVVKAANNNDPLDPECHQRMYLLFCSYSSRSSNAPDFCINPSIVRMELYGSNDVSLGQFLERHCFGQQYVCPSPTCQTPLIQHVRKFVHGDGCVTVTCVYVDSSTSTAGSRLIQDDDVKQNVMWWCRCLICGERAGSSSYLRPVSLAVSLAKYLEMRFNAPRYIRNLSCQHSLNQNYAHYFAYGNSTACFRYNKIKLWEICLPPSSIATHYNTRCMRDFLINQVNDLVLKGHEAFGNIGDGEQEKEHAVFKQHIEQIQLNLTSLSLQEQYNSAGIVRWLWNISDAVVVGEKIIQEAMEKLTAQTNAKVGFKITQDNIVEGKFEQKIEHDDNIVTDYNASDCVGENKVMLTNSVEVENTVEEEEDKGDRKGLRAILLQFLNNSHRALQNGVVLCGGVVPIVVRAGEISSLVAAALSSSHYHQQLHASLQTKGIGSDLDDKDIGSSREKLETDGKSKNSKTNEHIDVQLQDGLFCSVYHPKQFLKLRSLFLCPLKSNPNIKNDFDLKQTADDSNKDSKSDTLNESADNDGVKHSVMTSDREGCYSVEASPIMSLKKISDDKMKRASRDSQGKLGNGLIELSDVEEGFIRSLSRCVPWAARGGKSGSTFCKTKDDRYILKEMSKLELQLFIELAPHYFNYIQTCHKNNLPTLLARIFGVYRVSGVEGIGGGVLVMENLWHGRADLLRRFDLKGAERNRLAEPGAPDVVLLDENLLHSRWEDPLYLQSHSTSVLWAAIERDTSFLSLHHVMDYSLLVGLDEEKHELVLGIIDYIRTFTWDKKLEHIVKKGLGSGLPTIVSPEQYKVRFCTAMKKYFLQSPNQWEELDKGLICNVVEDS